MAFRSLRSATPTTHVGDDRREPREGERERTAVDPPTVSRIHRARERDRSTVRDDGVRR